MCSLPYRRTVAGKDAAFGSACPIAARQAEEDKANGFCRGGAARPGDSSNGNRKVDRRAGDGPLRHCRRGLGAYRAVRGKRFEWNSQQL
jgi:hypothetical protein